MLCKEKKVKDFFGYYSIHSTLTMKFKNVRLIYIYIYIFALNILN